MGQFQAEMASDSYQLQGMAERGFLPLALAARSRHGTPTLGETSMNMYYLCEAICTTYHVLLLYITYVYVACATFRATSGIGTSRASPVFNA